MCSRTWQLSLSWEQDQLRLAVRMLGYVHVGLHGVVGDLGC